MLCCLQGLKPTEVIEGYEMALKEAFRVLPDMVCKELDPTASIENAIKIIKPSVMSKQYGNHDFIAQLVAKACGQLLISSRSASSLL